MSKKFDEALIAYDAFAGAGLAAKAPAFLTEMLKSLAYAITDLVEISGSLRAVAETRSFVFDGNACFVGLVDRSTLPAFWQAKSVTLEEYSIARKLVLAAKGLIPDEEIYWDEPTYNGVEWTTKAEQLGARIPNLVSPITDNELAKSAADGSDEESVLSSPAFVARDTDQRIEHAVSLAKRIIGQVGLANLAIELLSDQRLDLLDRFSITPWRPTVRLYVLDRISVWPRQGRESLEFPALPELLVHAILNNDPSGEWREVPSKSLQYAAQLHATRSEEPDAESHDQEVEARFPDGPLAPDAWRHAGRTYRGLTPKPWRFCRALYEKLGQGVDLDAITQLVENDHAASHTLQAVGGWRSRANRFFLENGVPLTVGLANGFATMTLLDEGPTKDMR